MRSERVHVGGLSPPTRGNQHLTVGGAVWTGSIPAHAGEPRGVESLRMFGRVYPRPRGGTYPR